VLTFVFCFLDLVLFKL